MACHNALIILDLRNPTRQTTEALHFFKITQTSQLPQNRRGEILSVCRFSLQWQTGEIAKHIDFRRRIAIVNPSNPLAVITASAP
jgi:hypothetical protein